MGIINIAESFGALLFLIWSGVSLFVVFLILGLLDYVIYGSIALVVIIILIKKNNKARRYRRRR